jgi:hypothetical protein|tara:strand:- start:48 stop:518 length:471 start_codon:yes stop_codon:yes gene_type:complete
MSILKVDTINEKTSGNGVAISGHILQVKKSLATTSLQATSSTFVDSGHSLVITPHLATSEILLQLFAGGTQYNGGSPNDIQIRIKRNGTVILTNDRHMYSEDGTWNGVNYATAYIDSPSSTSALTYTFEFNGNRARFNDNNGSANTSHFIAMEIAQ